jgi:hypothetical protein
MCYSATASLTASVGLLLIGSIGSGFAIARNKKYLAINLLSFFYAIQQLMEGLIWLYPGSPWANTWAHIFLFFAFFVYPWYMAFSVRFFSPKRKKWLNRLTFIGLIYGAFLYYSVWQSPALLIKACQLHIDYQVQLIASPILQQQLTHYLFAPLYIALVALPFFICERRYSNAIGWLTVISAVLCLGIYTQYFISVWCFYAAMIGLGMSAFTYLSWRHSIHRLTRA